MKREKVIATLEQFNLWRTGVSNEPLNPWVITETINEAVRLLKEIG